MTVYLIDDHFLRLTKELTTKTYRLESPVLFVRKNFSLEKLNLTFFACIRKNLMNGKK